MPAKHMAYRMRCKTCAVEIRQEGPIDPEIAQMFRDAHALCDVEEETVDARP